MRVDDGPEPPEEERRPAQEAFVPGARCIRPLECLGDGDGVASGGQFARRLLNDHAFPRIEPFFEFIKGLSARRRTHGRRRFGGRLGGRDEGQGEIAAAVVQKKVAGGEFGDDPVRRKLDGEEAGIMFSPGGGHGRSSGDDG